MEQIKFRTRLRLWINYSGMTQAEVEKKTGLNRKTIGNYVSGRREPQLFALITLARVLNVTLDDLVFGLPPRLGEAGRRKTMIVTVVDSNKEKVLNSAEEAVLYLIEKCSPEFLGKLKDHGLLRVQKRLKGIDDMPEESVGKAAVKSVNGG